ncbi:MAG: hypothetical protein CSA68_01595 [Rhodobacterales bacterium]|nr:MAG: hypothetical protein CSA68_01595 [Rhodobacterales bacterium]
MKPNFVLNLSHEGISLLHRTEGGWHMIGEVALNDPDFNSKISYLHQTAAGLETGGVSTKLVIPNSQILYNVVDAPGPSAPERHRQIRAALDGTTPYQLDEISYDWCEIDGQVHIAAVAHETLQEAEGFAAEHGFNPVSFVAIPDAGCFAGEPFFGVTQMAARLLDATETVEPDGTVIQIVSQPKAKPRATPAQEPATVEPTVAEPAAVEPTPAELTPAKPTVAPTETPAPKQDAAEPHTPLPVFSSRRDHDHTPDPAQPAASLKDAKAEPPLAALPEARISLIPKLGGAKRDAADLPPPAAKPAKDNPAKVAPPPPKPKAKPAPVIPAKAAPIIPPAPAKATPSPAKSATPADEAEKMTLFGARRTARQRGKPRYLGLFLFLLLIVVLLIFWLWSSYFLENDNSLPPEDPAGQNQGAETGTGVNSGTQPGDNAQAASPPPSQPDLDSALSALEHPTIMRPAPLGVPPDQWPDDTTDLTIPPQTADVPRPPAGPQPEAEAELQAEPEPELDAEPFSQTDPDIITQAPAELKPLTQEAANTLFDETGIWQRGPENRPAPKRDDLNDLFLTSADPKMQWDDAIALPGLANPQNDPEMQSQNSPAAQGITFDLDARGLVVATEQGAMTPGGVMVYAKAPPKKSRPRPNRPPQVIVTPDQRLAAFRPAPRPGNLVEQTEKAQLGGRSRAELAAFRPAPRPISKKQAQEADQTPTEQAVLLSSLPRHRPRNFAKLVAISRSLGPSTTSKTKTPVPNSQIFTPSGKTRASVAKLATMKNALKLRRTSLIGVYGKAGKRRALVRLASGRYVKVKVGQRVDGGKVAAIGEHELRYVKGGRTIVLRMPKI